MATSAYRKTAVKMTRAVVEVQPHDLDAFDKWAADAGHRNRMRQSGL